MPFGRSGEAAAAIARRGIWRSANCGMKVECNHSSAGAGASRRAEGRRRCDDLRRTSLLRCEHSGTSARECALFVQGKLRSGSNHRTVCDVEIAETARCASRYVGWRSDHGSLRSLKHFPRYRCDVRRRRDNGAFHAWREARDLGRRNGWSGADRKLRLSRPCDDVGQRNVMLQLNIGRRDDGLRAIVRFRRQGNDGLSRVLRIGLAGLSGIRAASVERREVFRRRVVDDIGLGERGLNCGVRLQGEEARCRPDQG